MDHLALSGRGTHLIKAIMDEVEYTRVSSGNRLKLVKRLPGLKAREDGNPTAGRGLKPESAKDAHE
jgi:hypothetical protein